MMLIIKWSLFDSSDHILFFSQSNHVLFFFVILVHRPYDVLKTSIFCISGKPLDMLIAQDQSIIHILWWLRGPKKCIDFRFCGCMGALIWTIPNNPTLSPTIIVLFNAHTLKTPCPCLDNHGLKSKVWPSIPFLDFIPFFFKHIPYFHHQYPSVQNIPCYPIYSIPGFY